MTYMEDIEAAPGQYDSDVPPGRKNLFQFVEVDYPGHRVNLDVDDILTLWVWTNRLEEPHQIGSNLPAQAEMGRIPAKIMDSSINMERLRSDP